MGGETPMGERIAKLETLVPEMKEDMRDVKDRMERMCTKLDDFLREAATQASVTEVKRQVEILSTEVSKKADKKELDKVRERVLLWTGGGAVLLILVSWYGPKLLAIVAK